jgi:hypothetical protein
MVENRGKLPIVGSQNRRIANRPIAKSQIRSEALGAYVSFSNHYTTQRFALGVKSGNWHVFPIDNPTA